MSLVNIFIECSLKKGLKKTKEEKYFNALEIIQESIEVLLNVFRNHFEYFFSEVAAEAILFK